MPDMRPVYSSHIDAIGYDGAAGELHVRYSTGKTAVYEGVPPEKWDAVNGAWSIGEAVHGLVRGQHPHRYLGDETA